MISHRSCALTEFRRENGGKTPWDGGNQPDNARGVSIGSQSPFKGLLGGGVKQLGALHPKATTIFPVTVQYRQNI